MGLMRVAAGIEAVARKPKNIIKTSRKERPTEATLRLCFYRFFG